MKTKTAVSLEKSNPDDDSVTVSVSVTFHKNDPRADKIYTAFGHLIGSVLTGKESDEILEQLRDEYADLINQARS